MPDEPMENMEGQVIRLSKVATGVGKGRGPVANVQCPGFCATLIVITEEKEGSAKRLTIEF